MREILFRGKRIYSGEWVCGSLLSFDCGKKAILPSAAKVFMQKGTTTICCNECYDIVPSTLGQYTGMTDKNGVKIFEGDILESHYDDDYPDDIAIETIVWHGNAWCIKEGRSDPNQIEENGILPLSKVIGNIHDNPELLEKEGGE